MNTRRLNVRNNVYNNVAVGSYWNMGGLSAAVATATPDGIDYDSGTGLVTVTTTAKHKLWKGARVKIESAPNPAYDGLQRITAVTDLTFQYPLAAGLEGLSSGTATYRVVSGVDVLVIEGNTIELANLDETEFAIKGMSMRRSILKEPAISFLCPQLPCPLLDWDFEAEELRAKE